MARAGVSPPFRARKQGPPRPRARPRLGHLSVAKAEEMIEPMPGFSTSRDDATRWRRYWDRHASRYDRQMGRLERLMGDDGRAWACSQATGQVLEVAIGTGRNLPFYPDGITLTGIDLSPQMLAIARRRAQQLGREVELREGDAQELGFPEAAFDTVVCTFSLCGIPDERRAMAEMKRVLRPNGRLLLVDHVASSSWPARTVQRLLELVTVPLGNEHFLRRPLEHVLAEGLRIERQERFKLGIIERLAASKTPGAAGAD